MPTANDFAAENTADTLPIDAMHRLDRAVARLAPLSRQILFLSRLDGLTYTEIADRCARSLWTHPSSFDEKSYGSTELKATFAPSPSRGAKSSLMKVSQSRKAADIS